MLARLSVVWLFIRVRGKEGDHIMFWRSKYEERKEMLLAERRAGRPHTHSIRPSRRQTPMQNLENTPTLASTVRVACVHVRVWSCTILMHHHQTIFTVTVSQPSNSSSFLLACSGYFLHYSSCSHLCFDLHMLVPISQYLPPLPKCSFSSDNSLPSVTSSLSSPPTTFRASFKDEDLRCNSCLLVSPGEDSLNSS